MREWNFPEKQKRPEAWFSGFHSDGIVGAVRVAWVLWRDLSLWKPWKRSEGRYGGEMAYLVIDRGCISLWGNPEWYFPFWKTRGVFPIWKPRGVSAGCIVVALCWQWPVVFSVHPLVSSRYPLEDCHWDCSGDRPVNASAATATVGRLFSFFIFFLFYSSIYILRLLLKCLLICLLIYSCRLRWKPLFCWVFWGPLACWFAC